MSVSLNDLDIGGATQSGIRDHNEKLILSLLRDAGPIAGRDLARMTALSAQTVSVILRGLEQDGYLARGEPVRGKVGKPSVPMSLRGDAAWSFGLKIGRRSADIALMNLAGEIARQERLTYKYPTPEEIFPFAESALARMASDCPAPDRLCGIGLAVPHELWKWHDVIGAPEAAMSAWKHVDPGAVLSRTLRLPVLNSNDATAACRAEHHFGRGGAFRDYVYFFVGTFIGGGIVLNRRVLQGNQGNAGALGPLISIGENGPAPLLDIASIFVLEEAVAAAGGRPQDLWSDPDAWVRHGDLVSHWIERAGAALAQATLSACAIIDFEGVIIDGAFPPAIRSRLPAAVISELDKLDTRGLIKPRVTEGQVGGNARVIGAAYTPISHRFFLDFGQDLGRRADAAP